MTGVYSDDSDDGGESGEVLVVVDSDSDSDSEEVPQQFEKPSFDMLIHMLEHHHKSVTPSFDSTYDDSDSDSDESDSDSDSDSNSEKSDDDISYNSSYGNDVNLDGRTTGTLGIRGRVSVHEESNLLGLMGAGVGVGVGLMDDHDPLALLMHDLDDDDDDDDVDYDDEALLSEEDDDLDIDIGSSYNNYSKFTSYSSLFTPLHVAPSPPNNSDPTISIEERLYFCDFDQPLFTIVEGEQLLSMNVKKNHALFTTAKESDDADEESGNDSDGESDDGDDFDFEYVPSQQDTFISDYNGFNGWDRQQQRHQPLEPASHSDTQENPVTDMHTSDADTDTDTDTSMGRFTILEEPSKGLYPCIEVKERKDDELELEVIPINDSDSLDANANVNDALNAPTHHPLDEHNTYRNRDISALEASRSASTSTQKEAESPDRIPCAGVDASTGSNMDPKQTQAPADKQQQQLYVQHNKTICEESLPSPRSSMATIISYEEEDTELVLTVDADVDVDVDVDVEVDNHERNTNGNERKAYSCCDWISSYPKSRLKMKKKSCSSSYKDSADTSGLLDSSTAVATSFEGDAPPPSYGISAISLSYLSFKLR